MNKKTAKLLKQLACSTGDDLRDVFPELSDIIAMNCMTGFQPEDPDLQTEILTKADLAVVKDALIQYIENHEMESETVSAYWCLSKFFDDGLKDYFIDQLTFYYKKAKSILGIMGQIEICLSNLNEDIVSDESYSCFEYDKNMNDTNKYLKRKGIKL
jgi:hypothetical protein